MQVLSGMACRLVGVVNASVERLPMNVCRCDRPGWFGYTIESSGRKCENSQFAWNSWCVTSSPGNGGGSSGPPASPSPNTWNSRSE